MDNEPKTERQRVVEKLEKDLTKAAKAKRFVEGDGSLVLDYIAEFVTDFNRQLHKLSNTHEQNIALKAKIDVLMRLRGVLEIQGNEQALVRLREQLDLANSEE